MESEEQNRLLTQVGRATPMGELMRRYWQPICAAKTWCCFATARAGAG